MAEDTALATRNRDRTEMSNRSRDPFNRLRTEFDRMFDAFPSHFPVALLGSRHLASMPVPAVEITETDKEYRVSVEVPGIPHENINLSIDNDMLVLSGEKKDEREEHEKEYSISERSYGSFERRIALPKDARREGVEANTENGVIRIVIPRNKEPSSEPRRIEIRSQKRGSKK